MFPDQHQIDKMELAEVSGLLGKLDAFHLALRDRAAIILGFIQRGPAQVLIPGALPPVPPLAPPALVHTRAAAAVPPLPVQRHPNGRKKRVHRPAEAGFPISGTATVEYLSTSRGYGRIMLDGRLYAINGHADPTRCNGLRKALHRSRVGSTLLIRAVAMPSGIRGEGMPKLTRAELLDEQHHHVEAAE